MKTKSRTAWGVAFIVALFTGILASHPTVGQRHDATVSAPLPELATPRMPSASSAATGQDGPSSEAAVTQAQPGPASAPDSATIIAENDVHASFGNARKLEQDGKLQEAFLAFAAIPGAGHAAVQIGRAKPADYVTLLKAHAEVPQPLGKVIEGDLHLAEGDKHAALECYRDAARMVATEEGQTRKNNRVPRDPYICEPATSSEGNHFGSQPAQPYTLGPGSHRDNWLIRRFIALEAWDDAATEFARVWEIHRRYARPHRVSQSGVESGGKIATVERLVRPAGFDSLGLQFALDYAFFLKRLNRQDQAQAAVEEPLLAIDMDRNPNHAVMEEVTEEAAEYPRLDGRVARHFWGTQGVSRKEFVRLAYGVFSEAGREEALIDRIDKMVAGGENRLRRVLARMRFHQGRTDDALALELEYIEQGNFDSLSAAYRRGLIYEEANRTADALAAYEESLRMPMTSPNIPDPEERIGLVCMTQAVCKPMAVDGKTSFRMDVLGRLERLYGALGKPEKAFELSIREMEANAALFTQSDMLTRTALRADALGRQAAFLDWARQQATTATDPAARASLHWCSKDYAACVRDLGEQWKGMQPQSVGYAIDAWLERFRKLGKSEFGLLLNAALEADPKNGRVRLELLDLDEPNEGPELIAAFESLLETDVRFAFAQGKGGYNRTHFRNYYDLAYRLMRLYEKEEQPARLLALGLRIAEGVKPFDKWWRPELTQFSCRACHGANDLPEDLNACLALLVCDADAATLAKLDELWKDIPDCPAKRQLARRQAGGPAIPVGLKDIGWQHLPRGVRLLAGSANVLSLGRDENYVYAGHPWGIEVYDLEGKPITRIALAEPVDALAVADGVVWAGTLRGLYKIDTNGWSVSHLWLHGDLDPGKRYGVPFPRPNDYWFDNGVYTLVLEDEDLWIGMHRNIQRLNTRTMTLRAFSYRELRTENWIGINQIVPDGPYVWASGGGKLLRYDCASDTWDAIHIGKRDVGLIGLIDGKVFANAWLDDKVRYRPCIVNRETLKVTPLLIDAARSDAGRLVNSPFGYYGHRAGQIVLVGEGWYLVDENANRIEPLSTDGPPSAGDVETVLPKGFPARLVGWEWINSGKDLLLRNLEPSPCNLVVRGNRPVVFGRGNSENDDRRGVFCHEDRDSGLWFHTANKEASPVSQSPYSDRIATDTVFGVVEDPRGGRKWLATAHGLAMVDVDDRVVASLTRDDGLVADRITDGVVVDDRVYFSTAWGDHGGGLAILDPQTTLLTARFVSDGLATDKLAAIERNGDQLKLTYGIEYGRGGDYRYRQFPPGTLDPSTGLVKSGGAPQFFDDSNLPGGPLSPFASRSSPAADSMPFLGGRLLVERTIGDKTYLCGERGVVIFANGVVPEPAPAELTATLVVDPEQQLLAEAKATRLTINSPEDLRAALKTSSNPLVRANAIADVLRMNKDARSQFVAAIAPAVHDAHFRARATAVAMLSMIDDDAALSPVKEATQDCDPYIRALAFLTLLRHGQLPPIDEIERMLSERFGNFPFGADSSVGTLVDRGSVEAALAPHANNEIFTVLLKNPPRAEIYDSPLTSLPQSQAPGAKSVPSRELGNASLFEALGESLRGHPEAAKILLTAYDDESSSPIRREFSRNVFRFAGPEMLPLLYGELQSKDRVVRSNAARACGSIGGRDAIPHLLAALDLESGLARASIVWALGELKAHEALPRLAVLYVDARNEEKRRRPSGFLAAQAAAQFQATMEILHDSVDISAEWDELKQASGRRPLDPRNKEDLLDVRTIVEAVAKIGADSSQEFHRTLAGESDFEVRLEVAQRLGEVSSDRGQNVPVLRSLLGDQHEMVRMAAAASLLILGESDVRTPIVNWLDSPEKQHHAAMVRELARVKDGRLLVFARPGIERAAAESRLAHGRDSFMEQLLQRIPNTETQR